MDSVQVYFDTLHNARRQEQNAYGGDDYAYGLYMLPDDQRSRVWVEVAPVGQITTQANAFVDLPCTIRRVGKNTFYEIAFPASRLQPLRLSQGARCGFSVFVHDNDGEGEKQGVMLTEQPGQSPYAKPKQWPTLILGE
jgi:hypothetical protein